MFLHPIMTDSEILRTCRGCESAQLRWVTDRLQLRFDQLRDIQRTIDVQYSPDVLEAVKAIIEEDHRLK